MDVVGFVESGESSANQKIVVVQPKANDRVNGDSDQESNDLHSSGPVKVIWTLLKLVGRGNWYGHILEANEAANGIPDLFNNDQVNDNPLGFDQIVSRLNAIISEPLVVEDHWPEECERNQRSKHDEGINTSREEGSYIKELEVGRDVVYHPGQGCENDEPHAEFNRQVATAFFQEVSLFVLFGEEEDDLTFSQLNGTILRFKSDDVINIDLDIFFLDWIRVVLWLIWLCVNDFDLFTWFWSNQTWLRSMNIKFVKTESWTCGSSGSLWTSICFEPLDGSWFWTLSTWLFT